MNICMFIRAIKSYLEDPKGFHCESLLLLATIPRKRVSWKGEKTFRVWGEARKPSIEGFFNVLLLTIEGVVKLNR